MENNIDFQQRKKILDKLYEENFISGIEWYDALRILLSKYDLEKEINMA